MVVMLIIYGYYIFIPISIISTLIYDFKYEKYKKREGYKNNYKGTNMSKGLFDGHAFKTISKYFMRFFMPLSQIEGLIDLAYFSLSAKVDLNKEKAKGVVTYVDPNIIDLDEGNFEILGEEQGCNKEDMEEAIDEYVKIVAKSVLEGKERKRYEKTGECEEKTKEVLEEIKDNDAAFLKILKRDEDDPKMNVEDTI